MVLTATLKDGHEFEPMELEALMIQALVWSLGAALIESSRLRFDAYLKYLACMSAIQDETVEPKVGELPSWKTLYDFTYDVDRRVWVPWAKLVPEYVHDPQRKFYDILVPTVETFRATWLLQLMMNIKRPVVLVGETGTSKTATILDFLRGIDEETHLLLTMNFSSRTTSLDVQRNLEANVEKRTKDTYGPPSNKRLIIFIDDLNMPQQPGGGDALQITYGKGRGVLTTTQKKEGEEEKNYAPHAHLSSPCQWTRFPAAEGMCLCSVPTSRFVSLFSVFNMTFPDSSSLMKIYTSILSGHLSPFPPEISHLTEEITNVTMMLYA
ncbi:dynein heavy chain 10, axonemal-like [Aplysia californica]|uniref:Dynein heavy chain 10, axonemal-like n=1 Tax=Aplysia californica TaxID=6500 RepID=A0ABM1ADS9_APLCA|nr:dynein heavy chain 10, axonemal-like [Aplysia californica]